MRSIRTAALAVLTSPLFLASSSPAAPATELSDAIRAVFATRGEVYQPQLAVEADGTVLVVWREGGGRASDLFIAHRGADGSFTAPTRVNHEPGSVGGLGLQHPQVLEQVPDFGQAPGCIPVFLREKPDHVLV